VRLDCDTDLGREGALPLVGATLKFGDFVFGQAEPA
jgi:hypothetical protein